MNWFKDSFKLKRKQVNPLQTETERTVEGMLNVLNKYAINRREVITAVLKRGLVGNWHIQRHRVKKNG